MNRSHQSRLSVKNIALEYSFHQRPAYVLRPTPHLRPPLNVKISTLNEKKYRNDTGAMARPLIGERVGFSEVRARRRIEQWGSIDRGGRRHEIVVEKKVFRAGKTIGVDCEVGSEEMWYRREETPVDGIIWGV
jgi:hypothetical protein